MDKERKEQIKAEIGDDLCDFCPWRQGDIITDTEDCEDKFCDDALEQFMDENSHLYDDIDND